MMKRTKNKAQKKGRNKGREAFLNFIAPEERLSEEEIERVIADLQRIIDEQKKEDGNV